MQLMSWVRNDDMMPMHRKIRPLSDAAYRLHHSGICFASRHHTNGHILDADLEQVSDCRTPRKAVTELETRGLWEPTAIGWEIHDYLEYNPSVEEVLARREQRAAAGQRGGRASSEAKRKRVAKQTGSESLSEGEANFNPVPSRPVPSRKALVVLPVQDQRGPLRAGDVIGLGAS